MGGSGGEAVATFEKDGGLDDVEVTYEGSTYVQRKAMASISDRLPNEAANYSIIGNANQGINGRATVFMYLDGPGAIESTDPGRRGKYRYNRNGLTPDGVGKFRTTTVYDNLVYAFPYNTYRAIKIQGDGSWTDSGFDFGLEPEQYASSLVAQSTVDNRDVVYAIPFKKQRILKVVGSTLGYLQDFNGDDIFQGEWTDAVLDGRSNVIYAVPRNSDYILTIDTKQDRFIQRLVIPTITGRTGPNKFSSVCRTENGSGSLIACPEDADAFIDINPGAENARTRRLPAPGVLLESRSTVVYPPNSDGNIYTVDISFDRDGEPIVNKNTFSWGLVNQTYGDGCLIPGTNSVAWVPYYNITSTEFSNPQVIVVDYTGAPRLVDTSVEFDSRYAVAYPSRSVTALSVNEVAWCPANGSSPLAIYTISAKTVTLLSGYDRASSSITYASATSVSNGSDIIMVGSTSNDVLITNPANEDPPISIPGFQNREGSTVIRYQDTCITSDGLVVLAPAGNSTFKVYDPTLPDNETWTNSPQPPSGYPFVSGIKMGGCCFSSLDGKVYSVPWNHNRVLAYDITNNIVEEYGNDFPINSEMWGGCVEVPQSYIFGIPRRRGSILVIDPLNNNPRQKVIEIDLDTTQPELAYAQWNRGVYVPATNAIYCTPYYQRPPYREDPSDPLSPEITLPIQILVILPGAFPEDTAYRLITIPDTLYDWDTLYKWRSASLGPDGRIYFAPWDDPSILVFDPLTESFETIPTFSTLRSKFCSVVLTPRNTLLFIPARERSFLDLDVNTKRFQRYADYGTIDLKFSTAIYVPQKDAVFAFPRYLKGVEQFVAQSQYLFYFDGSTYTQGQGVISPFRMTPRVKPSGDKVAFRDTTNVGFLDDPTSIEDLGRQQLNMIAPITPGVFGWCTANTETEDILLTSALNDTVHTIIPDQGGFCGVTSFSGQCDLSCGIKDNNTFQCQTGETIMDIPFIFNGIYRDSSLGVLGVFSDATRMYTYYIDNEVGREQYSVVGDSGSRFSIGRISGRQFPKVTVPGVSTTFTGTMSELLVFKSDVQNLSEQMSTDQNFYFKTSQNFKLR
jgi:hypothetical protein